MSENSRELIEKEELKLDVFSILRALLKDWWMILTAGLVGMILAILAADLAYTPEYTSSMTFMVFSKGSTSNLSDLTTAGNLAETFGEVLNSRLLKKRVQEDLGMDYVPGKIETTVAEGTNLMTLKITASSPEHAFKIMKSVLNNYSEITDHVLKNVVLEVLEAPEVPIYPSNPVSSREMMKTFGMSGILIMACLLALLDLLKDNVKNEQDVERKLDTKLLTTIYHEEKNKTLRSKLSRKKKGLLVTNPTSSFQFVENFKKLRTKMVYKTDAEQKKKVILVTSVMENEGKSTVAVNLALTLAQKYEKVFLVDGDLRRPAVCKILDRKLDESQEIGEYLRGNRTIKDILRRDGDSGLFLMLGSRSYSNSTEMISGDAMRSLVSAARKTADFVIVDAPPVSLMADSEILAEYADVSLLVVRQSTARTKDINDTIDMLENGNSELLGCVFNDVKTGIFKGRRTWGGYGYEGYYRYGHYYGKYGYGKTAKSEKAGHNMKTSNSGEEQK